MWVDTLPLFAPVVSSVAASVSAVVAYGTIRRNGRNQEEARLSSSYAQLVSTHVHDYLGRFGDETLRLMQSGLNDLHELRAANALDRTTRRGSELIQEFKRMERSLSRPMMAGAEAFAGVPSVAYLTEESVDDAFETARNAAADRVSGIIVAWIGTDTKAETGSSDAVLQAIEEMIHEHTVRIYRVVLDHDPVRRLRSRPGWVRRVLPRRRTQTVVAGRPLRQALPGTSKAGK